MQQMRLNFSQPSKPVVNIWSQICTFDNLQLAYLKARKGKRQRDAVALFELHREAELFNLQQALMAGSYRPGAYRQFTIYESKPRTISAAPFRDRVVHHAIMHILQPLLEPMLYRHCYACRKGFGVHRAVDQYQYWSKRFAYVLKMDVQRYFPSVDQQVLLGQLGAVIHDAPLLSVLERIIRHYPTPHAGKGMAIGNLTSQFFANWYLREVDNLIAAVCGFRASMRYVDDFFVLGDDKEALWRLKRQVDAALKPLGLVLHQHKAVVCQTREKVPILGYQVSRERRWLQAANAKKAQRKLLKQARACQQKTLQFKKVQPSVRAWVGHAQHGQTLGLRRALLAPLVFS